MAIITTLSIFAPTAFSRCKRGILKYFYFIAVPLKLRNYAHFFDFCIEKVSGYLSILVFASLDILSKVF